MIYTYFFRRRTVNSPNATSSLFNFPICVTRSLSSLVVGSCLKQSNALLTRWVRHTSSRKVISAF